MYEFLVPSRRNLYRIKFVSLLVSHAYLLSSHADYIVTLTTTSVVNHSSHQLHYLDSTA